MAYALQLNAGSTVTFTDNAGVRTAAKIGGRVRLLGSIFKDLGDNAINRIFSVDDGTNTKFKITISTLFGGSRVQFDSDVWGATAIVLDLASVLASLSDTVYYELEFSFDPTLATNRCVATLYDTDGTTVIATAATNSNSNQTALITGAGLVVSCGTGTNNKALTLDWFKLNNLTSTVFDAEFNEGTGTSTADSVGSATGTISGTSSWISLGGPTLDHGDVSLSNPTVSVSGAGTATVVWKDSSGTPLPTQPSTTWDVVNLGATIDASGNYTGAAAGTATIRATTGAITATATLTISPKYTFGGQVTVA